MSSPWDLGELRVSAQFAVAVASAQFRPAQTAYWAPKLHTGYSPAVGGSGSRRACLLGRVVRRAFGPFTADQVDRTANRVTA